MMKNHCRPFLPMNPKHHNIAGKALYSHIIFSIVVVNEEYLPTKYTGLFKVMITNTSLMANVSIIKMVFVALLQKVMMEKKLVSLLMKLIAKIAGEKPAGYVRKATVTCVVGDVMNVPNTNAPFA